jgi:3-isopropylmalate/(R)-2-methylmalate dehydratase large subunit
LNITEKILAKHAGKKLVQPGEIIRAKVDLIFAHDLTTGLVMKQLEEMGVDKIFDPAKVASGYGAPTADRIRWNDQIQ